MNADNLIEALKKRFKVSNQRELADMLGVAQQTLINWKNGANLTPAQVASLLEKSRTKAIKDSQEHTIKPIVEFFAIERFRKHKRSAWKLFNDEETVHKRGLKDDLDEKQGIYIFYDSRGQALYVGKAERQSLWKEMNLVFNRDREKVQRIKLINHPNRNQKFTAGDEMQRQPVATQMQLHEMAHYLSAYKIDKEMISSLEALMVRGFANDLLNVKMEKFKKG